MKQYMLMILLCQVIAVDARVKRVKSLNELMARLAAVPYAVVLFCDKNKQVMSNPVQKQMINDLEIMFRSVSDDPQYRYAGLPFMIVDVARDKMVGAARAYGIQMYPSIIAFSGSRPVAHGAVIQGAVGRDNLVSYIGIHLGQKIDVIMKEKDAARQRALENAQIMQTMYAPYFYSPYWYYGYNPYWGFGYPYGPWGAW
jgi:hypothetical protein